MRFSSKGCSEEPLKGNCIQIRFSRQVKIILSHCAGCQSYYKQCYLELIVLL